MADSLVIIDDIDFERVRPSPAEDDPPLAVDPNAPPAEKISLQSLQAIPGDRRQVRERGRRVQHRKPLLCALLYVSRQVRGVFTVEYEPRCPAAE